MHSPLSPSPLEQVVRDGSEALFVPVDLRLPARAAELKRVRDCVSTSAADFGFDHKRCYELAFAVNEAITNAIKHGSPDSDGTIGLRIDADGDWLVCSVSDCGPFVRRSTPPDPDSGESGRGFPFMTAFTDELELITEPGSTIVRLRKRLAEPSTVSDA